MLEAWLWSLIPTFFLAVPATTVYLHRTVTHRALRLHPFAEGWFKLTNWISTGVDPAVWAAVHRKHHAYSDVEVAPDRRDPHSPWLEGFWHIQLGNVWYYLAELRKHPETLTTFARDVLNQRGWLDRHVFRRGWAGLLTGTVLLCLIVGVGSWLGDASLATAVERGLAIGCAAAGIHAITFVFLLNPSVNALCHWPHRWLGGYQNSKAAHAWRTANNWIVAALTAGEGFHNNHHAQPGTARFAWTKWEAVADWGYWAVILPLQWTGLAKSVRLPREPGDEREAS
ncbi:MAG: fatty acid desaturase [Vicinamibacterales bacterium]